MRRLSQVELDDVTPSLWRLDNTAATCRRHGTLAA